MDNLTETYITTCQLCNVEVEFEDEEEAQQYEYLCEDCYMNTSDDEFICFWCHGYGLDYKPCPECGR